MSQLIVYTQFPSKRVDYIFSTLLPALGLTHYRITSDVLAFKNADETKINYSSQPVAGNEVWIQPATLLFENRIETQILSCFDYNGSKAFYKTSEGDFPFDIFAASFYLISRYEEYLPHKLDMYERYPHENSLAYNQQFLQLPLVNVWLIHFAKLLRQKFPSLTLHPKRFSFVPTYDIDIAYSYLYKGAIRNIAGFIKSAWMSEWALVKERMNVLFGNQQDPFDSFGWLDELHQEFHLKPIYFFLLADKNKKYDRNILPAKPAMKSLIANHAGKYEIGIHPSWQSGDDAGLLKSELKKLEAISGQTIYKSRQHYIRMNLPETYRQLIEAGITQDYSMGYGSINGFRASYCLPFLWYDLQKEETTNLTIYPFCYMDANSYYEQHYDCDQALDEMKHYYSICKLVDGLFITIWHNHFLGTDKMFKGWPESYRTAISGIIKD